MLTLNKAVCVEQFSNVVKMLQIRTCLNLLAQRTVSVNVSRHSSNGKVTELKKFYKNVTISQVKGGYEINLDQRKLKTPLGKLFVVPTEPLALAAATEWDSQDTVIRRHSMHLNSLCNTAIDNPTGRSKDTVIDGILDYLETDTICYRVDEPEELVHFQQKQWDPLIHWLRERYGVTVEATTGIGVPNVPPETLDLFRQHLESFNDWALVGYQQAVESLKSLIIAFALIDRHITVQKAVQLSRLELEFQIAKWGNVEWYHDIDLLELRARIASATLFVHLNSEETITIFNKSASRDPV